MRTFLTLGLLASVALGFSACEKQESQPPPQNPQVAQGYPPPYPNQYPQPYPQQYPQNPQPYPQQYPQNPQPYPQQVPPPNPVPPAPAPQPQPPAPPATQPAPAPTFPFPLPGPAPAPAPAGASATPIDPNLAAAATVPLFVFAATEAPNMQKEGTLLAGQYQQGQTLEQTVNLGAGKCYTVLAVGVGVQEVDITLMLTTPIPGMNPVLQRDSGAGHQASLGGKGNCYKWPAPLPAQGKYVVTASKGAGIIASQLYAK